jgi:hypothetical protein
MADDSTTGLKSSRPAIFVGGQENGPLAGGLLELLIVENTQGLYRCEAKFGNWGETNNTTGFLYFDRSVLDFGKDFQIKLGSDAIFNGKIMGLEASFPEGQAPEIRVLAEDRFKSERESLWSNIQSVGPGESERSRFCTRASAGYRC